QVHPGGQALVQPVLAPPRARPGRDVDVAEVAQADGLVPGRHGLHFHLLTTQGNSLQCSPTPRADREVVIALLTLCEGLISMPKVSFVNEKQEIEVPQGGNLRTEARKAGVEVHGWIESYLNCMGNGLCGTCRVLVKKGMENLNPKTTMEKINLNAHPLTM